MIIQSEKGTAGGRYEENDDHFPDSAGVMHQHVHGNTGDICISRRKR